MRTLYTLNSVRRLRKSLSSADTSTDYWQAGKSVGGIHSIEPAAAIVSAYAAALK
jgi:nitronate monooxygenase